MELLKDVKSVRDFLGGFKGASVGFVPTMGFLHEGHLSLIRKAASENDLAIVSIFVNPTQFGPAEDLDAYPRDLERDLRLCEQAGVAGVFAPSPEEMYGREGTLTWINVEKITEGLCGASRPVHFRGVCTVVAKLINIVSPDRAYFGMKDYQQYRVISRMAADLNMRTEIIPCPLIREADGLAMSSRNKYLSAAEREDALSLNTALRRVKEMLDAGERDCAALIQAVRDIIGKKSGTRVDYIETVHPETLEKIESVDRETGVLTALAVYVGKTRLIDNLLWGYGKQD